MKIVAAVAGALALAGCATRPTAPPPVRPVPPVIPAAPAVSAATYVAQAGSMDLFVVRSSELALTRSSNSRIRVLAAEFMAGHRGTGGQLSLAGRRLDLLPPATMLPQHQAMMAELEASSDFDRTYIRLQRSVHGAAYNLHSDYAVRGTSPTLRPVARNARAVEQAHLEMLRRF